MLEIIIASNDTKLGVNIVGTDANTGWFSLCQQTPVVRVTITASYTHDGAYLSPTLFSVCVAASSKKSTRPNYFGH